MDLFGRNKDKISEYDKIIGEFNIDRASLEVSKQYEEILNVYKDIKTYYKDCFKNDQIDIKIEKIRIEKAIGKHPNSGASFTMSYYVTIAGSIFYFMIQNIISIFDKYSKVLNVIGSSIFLLIMLYYVTTIVGKDLRKDKSRNLMLNISLQVLEDIEKEIDQCNNNTYYAEDEIAATVENEKDNNGNKIDDHRQNQINGLINIVFNKKINMQKEADK